MSIQTPSGRLEPGTTQPVDASTVLLVRGVDGGLEVFVLRRHLDSDFAGGAYAFPGGKVDEMDRDLAPELWRGIDPWELRARFGVRRADDVLGLHVAAVRETFEEAGVLLATRDGKEVTADELATASYRQARERLAARGEHWDWRPWLADEGLVLELGSLAPWSWWVTPHGLHKRFDTRFFLAQVPGGQRAVHDDVEATASHWATPDEILQAAGRGEAVVIFPTRKNLEALAEHGDVEEALAHARRGSKGLRKILPALQVSDGTVRVRHPDGGAPEGI